MGDATKVWRGDGWEVRHGRWQESPPDEVDVIIADAPYDETTHEGGRANSADGPVDRELTFDPVTPDDIALPLVTKARRWVVVFCAVEQLGDYKRAAGDAYIRGGAWVKTNPTPQISGDRPAAWGEGLAIMHRTLDMGRKGHMHWNGGGYPARYYHSTARADRHHETAKPLGLMLQLVEHYSDPGELVWDPYGGSMTTGVACLQTGRRFLGHEMQEGYAEVGAERLHATEQGLTLEDYRAGQQPLFAEVS